MHHHDSSSRMTSPVRELTCSENDSVASDRTTSDTTLFSSNVFYTPLSESSCTTISGCEPPYERLCSSVSFSQLSQYSTGEVHNNEYSNICESFPKGRHSYQEGMRPCSGVDTRFDLETLSHQPTEIGSTKPSSDLTKTQSRFVSKSWESAATTSSMKKKLCDEKSFHLPRECLQGCYENVHGTKKIKKSRSLNIPILPADASEWKKNYIKRENSVSEVPRPLSAFGPDSGDEIFRKFDSNKSHRLSLNLSVNESPYELIAVKSDRISPSRVGNEVTTFKGEKSICETGYEEIEPSIFRTKSPVLFETGKGMQDDGYEEVSPGDFQNFGLGVSNSGIRSSYEEMRVPEICPEVKESTSPSEFSENFGEFMIENNLYEPFTPDKFHLDVTPKPCSETVDSASTLDTPQYQVS